MNARKIIFIIALFGVGCFVAIYAVAIYFLSEKEKKDNSSKTAAARAKRWPNSKDEENNKRFEPEESLIVENENSQTDNAN